MLDDVNEFYLQLVIGDYRNRWYRLPIEIFYFFRNEGDHLSSGFMRRLGLMFGLRSCWVVSCFSFVFWWEFVTCGGMNEINGVELCIGATLSFGWRKGIDSERSTTGASDVVRWSIVFGVTGTIALGLTVLSFGLWVRGGLEQWLVGLVHRKELLVGLAVCCLLLVRWLSERVADLLMSL